MKQNLMPHKYPLTKKGTEKDTFFGTQVHDPYRWLEDDFSEETKHWVDEQNEATETHLRNISFKNEIHKRLEKLWNHERYSCPFKKAEVYFYFHNNGLQNQDVLYMTSDLQKQGEIVLDPNTFSEDGTRALSVVSVSDDAKHIAYSVSQGGSDWNEIYVKNIQQNTVYKEPIKWVKFSGMEWHENGFFYARYPEPKEENLLKGENTHCRIHYHKIDTSQQQDVLVLEDSSKPEWGFTPQVISNRWLVIYVTESTSGNGLWVKDLDKPNADWIKIVNDFNHDFHIISYFENQFIVLTNYNAPTYQIISIDPLKPQRENWETLIPHKKDTLLDCKYIGGKLVLSYLHNAYSVVHIYRLDGTFNYEIKLAGIGTVNGFEGDPKNSLTFYSYSSFATPQTIYQFDVEQNTSTLWKSTDIDFPHQNYVTEQVFYPSKDGTLISMFLTHKKGLKKDKNRPTLLYGYGGFNIPLTPEFDKTRLIWLENDGVFAVPNLRGGGEYGENWHKQGTLLQKQNVFDDFIAAAEYLIVQNYTSQKRLTIHGGSNGGLLVGAVSNQRPDLFAVSLPAVGVMDMLRYHKFTIGRYWASDYGTSETSKEMFDYLLHYSPTHNVKENTTYPAILISTADHDDRVVPAHSFKYIAELQEKQFGINPRLIRIEKNAGHGAGKPTSMLLNYYSDLWSFAFHYMNVTPNYSAL